LKIMHIADVHLDSKMNRHLSNEKAKERRAELLASFVRLIDTAKREGVTAVLIAGDLFDVSKVKVGTAKTIKKAIADASDISFFYIRGNHDNQNIFENTDDVPPNIHLFGESWQSYNISDKVTVTGAELMGRNSSEIDSSLVLENDKFNIVMLHGTVVSSNTSKGKELINIKGLKNKGIDYLALGHIHSYVEDKLDGRGRYVYSGCPFGRGFDECGEKGYVIIDIDEVTRSAKAGFVTFPARRLYAPEVDITECTSTLEIVDKVKEVVSSYDSSYLIEAVLTGSIDAELDINIPFIEKSFEEAFYVFKCKDETKIHIDADKFAKDASLRGEFVRLVMSRDDMDEEEKMQVIRLGIAALQGEEL